MEDALTHAFAQLGYQIKRAHPYDEQQKHGFIYTQRMGLTVFESIPKNARVIVATAVWQYSYHVAGGLLHHNGPILTVANWSGEWPGLVGLLNLNASLAKMGVRFSTIWSEKFNDAYFVKSITEWLDHGIVHHDTSHRHELILSQLPSADVRFPQALSSSWLLTHSNDTACSW